MTDTTTPASAAKGEFDGLAQHFEAMQDMMRAYLIPEDYMDRDGKCHAEPANNQAPEAAARMRWARADAFANDMIYMLDGPEQRQVQLRQQGDPADLRAALEPFASKYERRRAFHGEERDGKQIEHRLGDFRNAYEALKSTGASND